MTRVLPFIEAFIIAIVTPAFVTGVFADWWVIIPAAYVTTAHTLVLAAPLFLLFRSRGWFNLASSMAGGVGVGLVPIAILSLPLWGGNLASEFEWQSYIQRVCLFAGLGGLSGLVFWVYLWLRGSVSPNSAPTATGEKLERVGQSSPAPARGRER